jgi:ankyrin repeat protein
LLLPNQAPVSAGDRYGQTPLHWAVDVGNREIAEWLLAHGADVNARSRNGETALHVAARVRRREIAGIAAGSRG